MLKDQDHYKHEGVLSAYKDAKVVILGVPFDGTTSFRPGTRFGPSAVRQELDGLETYSPYQDKDMVDYRMCDVGDVELPFGNTGKMIERVYAETMTLLKDKKMTLTVGGEHLISYPIIKAHINTYDDLHIIQLDAHADLREDYLGEKMSHATVMRRVIDEMTKVKSKGKLWQYGIRSGTKAEFDFAKKRTHLHAFDLEGVKETIDGIGDKPVYVTIDLDVLDPSIFAGTGTPEPGGVDFKELMKALLSLKGLNVVGADIVELAPHYDQSGVSTAVACKVLREVALLMV